MDFGAVLQQKFPAGKHPRLCIERVEIDGRICVVEELTKRPRSIEGLSCACTSLQPWRCIWADAQLHQPKAMQLVSIFICLHKSGARMHQLSTLLRMSCAQIPCKTNQFKQSALCMRNLLFSCGYMLYAHLLQPSIITHTAQTRLHRHLTEHQLHVMPYTMPNATMFYSSSVSTAI